MAVRQEKRATPRVTTVVPVHCRVLHLPVFTTENRRATPENNPEFEARTINVSQGGMLLNTEMDLWPRTELELTLSSPIDGKPMRITAEVAWSRRNAMNLFGRYGAGVKFKRIHEKDRIALQEFFKPL